VHLAHIIAERSRAIVQAWAGNDPPLVSVSGIGQLPRMAHYDMLGQDADIAPLGSRGIGLGVFAAKPGDKNVNTSVWVPASSHSYKEAYIRFINRVYGQAFTKSDMTGFDADHMLNRARAPQGSTYIRVEGVPSAANQAWGRLFEKASSHPGFYANQHREMRKMSYVICAKLAGQMPPAGPLDRPGIERLASFFASVGVSRKEALDGLQSMLDFAYGAHAS